MQDNVSLRDIYQEIQDFRSEMRTIYVTKDRFHPIEKIVYGSTTLVLMTIIGALLAQVVTARGF